MDGRVLRTVARVGMVATLVSSGAVGLSLIGGSTASASVAFSAPVEVSGSGGGGGEFEAVSCPEAGDCTAVGTDNNSVSMYATESGGVWGSVTELPEPGFLASLWGVSCAGVGDCTAVGGDDNDKMVHVTETSGTWGPVTEIPYSAGSFLSAVSCSDAADCTAVGAVFGGNAIQVTETGGVWGTPTVLANINNGSVLSGVSCTGASDCTAAGNESSEDAVVDQQTSGSWNSSPSVLQASPNTWGEYLSSISCNDAQDCTAVGSNQLGIPGQYGSQPTAATESGGVWGVDTQIDGVPGGSGTLVGVSCTDIGSCTAVGADTDNMPLVDIQVDGVWQTPWDVAGTPGGGGQFTAVSCPGQPAQEDSPLQEQQSSGSQLPGDCTAVGVDDNDQPIASSSTSSFSMTYLSGSPQYTTVGTSFAAPLQVTVLDGQLPDVGATVIFRAPTSGASGTFANGSTQDTAFTNAAGVATAPTFTANGIDGGYVVEAIEPGAPDVPFSLDNDVGPPDIITATGGGGQTSVLGAAFGSPLEATVTDSYGNPIFGATVTFDAPGSGASAVFANGLDSESATTGFNGVASVAVSANASSGSYDVTASSPGVANTVTFQLSQGFFVPGGSQLLPPGILSHSYSHQLLADGGIGTLSWRRIGGSLPGGLSLRSDGLLSGKVSPKDTLGSYSIEVEVRDSNKPKPDTATVELSMAVEGISPAFTSADAAKAQVGRKVSVKVTTTGEPAATISSVGLPSWLALTTASNGRAEITGIPPTTSAGTYAVSLIAQNPAGTAVQSFTLTVAPAP